VVGKELDYVGCMTEVHGTRSESICNVSWAGRAFRTSLTTRPNFSATLLLRVEVSRHPKTHAVFYLFRSNFTVQTGA
jgi:hypothetical protein